MKLSHLRDVLAVAELGSLRAAGRHIGIAQPAITRSIREIEQELGVTLFERHAKGVHLTTMGAAFVRRAETIRAELRRAKDEIEQMKGRTTGEVSIALSTATCMALMPRALTLFRQRYPDAVLKVSESLFPPIESELIDGTLDLYVGPLAPGFSSPQLAAEMLFDNRRMVFARHGHPLSNARSLSDLSGADWVRPTMSIRSTEGDFDEIFARAGLAQPRIVLHARSALVTLIAVANSDMLTILPQQWLNFSGSSAVMAALPIDEVMMAAPISIVRRRDMPLTPMAEHLCDLMRRIATHYSYRDDALPR